MAAAGEKGIAVLTPAESKRLIAAAVASLPEVQRALRRGRIIVAGGTTNAYVAEALTGEAVHKFWYTAGRIAHGKLGSNEGARRIPPVVLVRGKRVNRAPAEVLEAFTRDDVFIKGANAVDPSGMAGVLMGDARGGTIGAALGILKARGSHLVVPVGLEKLVPSVAAASGVCGQGVFRYAIGDPVGFMPLVGAKVVTEIEALRFLFGLEAVLVASGGVAGSEGAVVLAMEGPEAALRRAFRFLEEKVKGEPPVRP